MQQWIDKLSEQQIIELILLLDDHKVHTAQVMLQQQLDVSAEDAEHIVRAFARLQNIALPEHCSATPIGEQLEFDDPSQPHPITINASQPQVFARTPPHKTLNLKTKRLWIAVSILLLVLILGWLFA
jgi:hypothetical protein